MQHTAKGQPKIVKRCSLPLTSARPVDLVVTELAVIGFPGGRATLLEVAPGVTVDEVRAATEAELAVCERVSTMVLQ
jgi:acetate CoA/acetoacetate CoA-transferase beta subunit